MFILFICFVKMRTEFSFLMILAWAYDIMKYTDLIAVFRNEWKTTKGEVYGGESTKTGNFCRG